MHHSTRCVLPVTSTRRLRKMRSTSQGEIDKETRRQGDKETGAPFSSPCLLVSLSPCLAPSGICWKASSSSYRLSLRASSTRGAWLVGPTNRPEKRYDSDGWLCQ